ncbi:MAG: hypothetical protein K9J37_16290, partial [Saprospiraceae bacterium]|nr:hypothetical protein [Saprospiraceae bacterium]MCF8280724.1 hypothetical protein [Bacteroidales bacterium]MCF8313334.1 hypothetical protein [Saprospiraceae bacterium]
MAAAIGRETIDLSMETVRKGSPHTLKLTKTQAAYLLALKHWEEDMVLLGRMGKGTIGRQFSIWLFEPNLIHVSDAKKDLHHVFTGNNFKDRSDTFPEFEPGFKF